MLNRPERPAESPHPRPLSPAVVDGGLGAILTLLTAFGLTAFVALQYTDGGGMEGRLQSLLRPRGMWRELVRVAFISLPLVLGLTWALARRSSFRRAAEALGVLALLGPCLLFDDVAGRQLLAAGVVGLTAWRVWPLLISAGPQPSRRPGHHRFAAASVLGIFTYLLLGAVLRHNAHWSSLIDLGLFYELYDNAQGQVLYAPTLGQSFLGEHFSPILVLLAPIMQLFSSPVTLLVIQAAAVSWGAWLLYRLAFERTDSGPLSLAIMLAWALSPYVQGAAFYDFHMDMLEPPMLFGLMLALHRRRDRWLWLCAIALWLTKEDAFIYTSVIGVYAWWFEGRRRLGPILVAVSLVQAAIVLGWALPALRVAHDPAFFSTTGAQQGYAFASRYGNLGNSLGTVAGTLGNPLYLMDWLTSGARLTGVIGLFVAFFGLGLFAGWRLILLIPTLEMLLAGHGGMHSFAFYYGAVAFMFAPLVAIEGARNLMQRGFGGGRMALALAVTTTVVVGWHPNSWISSHNNFKPTTATAHQETAERLMHSIPEGAVVAATGYQAVHLQPGRSVTMLPYGVDAAEWILIDSQRPPWPLSYQRLQSLARSLPHKGYLLVEEAGGLLLLRHATRGTHADAAAAAPYSKAQKKAAQQRIVDALQTHQVEAELTEHTGYMNRVVSGATSLDGVSDGVLGGVPSNGAFLRIETADRRGPGFALYGPFVDLERGAWDAHFRLRWTPASVLPRPPETPVVTLDVAANHGREVLAKRVLRAGELDGEGWSDHLLGFKVQPGKRGIELRVYYHDVGNLDLDATWVSPTPSIRDKNAKGQTNE